MSLTMLRSTAAPALVRPRAVRALYADVEGTVNDPTTFPPPNKAHGQYHWTFERLLSAALVPLVGATAVSSVNPVLDGVLCTAIVAHTHMGFDNILTDYLHPRKFPVLGRIMAWGLRLATAGVLIGVYQFETNDIGLTELLKKMWHAHDAKKPLTE
ncbi:membrane anchor subunit of succinate dehydrogenase, Sdh4 [Rhodotorula sphaerocarpa]